LFATLAAIIAEVERLKPNPSTEALNKAEDERLKATGHREYVS